MKISLVKDSKAGALRAYFSLLQFVFPKEKQLTELEIELLILFLSLPEKFKYSRFSTLAKNKVIEIAAQEQGWKLSRINVNNKLYSLIDKGVLVRDEDGVIYINKTIDRGISQLIQAIGSNSAMEITFEIKWKQES